MQTLKALLNICVYFSIFAWIIIVAELINNIYAKYFKKSRDAKKILDFSSFNPLELDAKTSFIVKTVLICGTIYYVMGLFVQTTTLGSLFEKEEYKAYYYVNMFPSEYVAKNYRVKAEIIATWDEWSDGERQRAYRIEKAFMPNGGIISFENNAYDNDPLEIGEKININDDKGREWYIMLTAEKAK